MSRIRPRRERERLCDDVAANLQPDVIPLFRTDPPETAAIIGHSLADAL
ncbi:hypothetical protein SAMN02927923_00156 [Microvirga guangxiensis]|uniref:Uncharacterized protein n=1 Tax=Microvirga guangxiensis TaxID=549386 RepID=A0A1G5B827_9HYPH|nr:hypothetical protein SAMN02927923_00156 [Microvirga guangxiensis]